MKRTRKWAFVEQEAKRLAALGLAPIDIAKRIGVNKSTVTRWVATGKLQRRIPARTPADGKTPAQWAASVRKDYSLDATDEQLVMLAQTSLEMSQDASMAPHVRMNAAGRFQAIARQLALVARLADAEVAQPRAAKAEAAKVAYVQPARRVDPRQILTAVK